MYTSGKIKNVKSFWMHFRSCAQYLSLKHQNLLKGMPKTREKPVPSNTINEQMEKSKTTWKTQVVASYVWSLQKSTDGHYLTLTEVPGCRDEAIILVLARLLVASTIPWHLHGVSVSFLADLLLHLLLYGSYPPLPSDWRHSQKPGPMAELIDCRGGQLPSNSL